MKKRMGVILITMILMSISFSLSAQNFDCGSNGNYGPLVIPATSGTVTLALPGDGIFHCTMVSVEEGATLMFARNSLNTPVYILSKGDIEIGGTIDISGKSGTATPPKGGEGGPGGFDGGMPGVFGTVSPGDGQGPGGGKGGTMGQPTSAGVAGGGAYSTLPWYVFPQNQSNYGKVHGSPLLAPLLGGSGGGGAVGKTVTENGVGGGGGGAILLASNTKVILNAPGKIISRGGSNPPYSSGGQGSGGGIRIVAPEVKGNGSLDVSGGSAPFDYSNSVGGSGRIRIDTYFRSELQLSYAPNSTYTRAFGSFMSVFPPNNPRLDIIKAAGTDIPEGTGNAVQILMPFDSPTEQVIRVQARNYFGKVPITVALIPDTGSTITYDDEIDMDTGNPAYVDVITQMPKNVQIHIYAWTR